VADAPRYDDSLTIALLRAREAVTAQFRDHVAAGGLTLTQWRVIRALAGGTELDTTTLAHRCVILAPSLTRLLKTPEGRGLLEKVPALARRPPDDLPNTAQARQRLKIIKPFAKTG